MADAKQIQIEVYMANLPPILGDINRWQQVVMNLLTNAIKFTPAHGRVEIRLDRVEGEGERGRWGEGEMGRWGDGPMPHALCPMPYAQITVTDTGKGISPEFLPQIFDRFQQGQQSSGAKDGLGLGLAIAKKLVELHGGTIAASSPGIGQGATFTIELPLPEPDGSNAEIATAAVLGPLAGIRIVAVDDEPDSLDIMQIVLEDAGAEVRSASNPHSALHFVAPQVAFFL